MNTSTPVRIIDIDARHPLFAFLSVSSRSRIFDGGLPAEVVRAGDGTPTAIRYMGEVYGVTGVEYVAA